METDNRLNKLILAVYFRSLRIFDAMLSLINDHPEFTFKQPLFFKSKKTVFDKQRLKRNSVLLGIYLQHTIIDKYTDQAFAISEMGIYAYLTFEHPSASREEKRETVNKISSSKMLVFDDINMGRHPLHVGSTVLPVKGSFSDNPFYRYAVWLVENSLSTPAPLYGIVFITEVVASLTFWFSTVVEELNPEDFDL